MGEFLKVRPSLEPQGPTPQDIKASRLAQTYPCLFEYLTLTRWEDGAARQTASVSVFFDEGRLKACLSDREMGRIAFVAGYTLEDLLRSIEEGLLSASLDWRPLRQVPGRVGKKS